MTDEKHKLDNNNPYNEPQPEDDGDYEEWLETQVYNYDDELKYGINPLEDDEIPEDYTLFNKIPGWEDLKKKKLESWKEFINHSGMGGELLQNRSQEAQYEAELFLEGIFVVGPMIKNAAKNPGTRTDLVPNGTRLKKDVVAEYGLTKKQAWLAEQLTREGLDHEIETSRKENRSASLLRAITWQKQEKARVENLIKDKEISEKIRNAKKPEECEKFDVIYVDLTNTTENVKTIKTMDIPTDEKAMGFFWVEPDKLLDALEIMKYWGFEYKDNAIWNRDVAKQGGDWVQNTHTMLLIGMKGDNYSTPNPAFRLKSIHFQHKTDKQQWTPDYYYGLIEKLCPGANYLEVFSVRQYNDKWTLFETNQEDDE